MTACLRYRVRALQRSTTQRRQGCGGPDGFHNSGCIQPNGLAASLVEVFESADRAGGEIAFELLPATSTETL
jgi:hypothetical protein